MRSNTSRFFYRTPPLATFAILALLGAPGMLSACEGTRLSGEASVPADGLRTTVTPDLIVAGEIATVSCDYVGQYRDYTLATEFVIEDSSGQVTSEGLTIDGDVITATRSGVFTVRCQSIGGNIVDATGATLTVMPGNPVAVAPYFDDNPIEVNSWTGVYCGAIDEYGNGVPVSGTINVDAPLVVQGDQITSAEVGAFPVTCTSTEYPNLPRESVDLHVVPGPPAQVVLMSSPERAGYFTGQLVTLFWELQDQWGNFISRPPGVLTAPVAPSVQTVNVDEHKFRFSAEGRYIFSVTLNSPMEGLSDEHTIIVDDGGPEITIKWPPRGATIEGDGSPVMIQGNVTDAWTGIESFSLNGDEVVLGTGGSFSVPMTPHWGVNVIEATATDGTGNQSKLTPTFQYSERFLPFEDENAEGLKHDDGLRLLLGQNFWDDGVHDHTQLDDIATILELLLSGIDIGALIDGQLDQFEQTIPIVSWSQNFGIDSVAWVEVTFNGDIQITLESTSTTGIGATRVDIDSRMGGLDLSVAMGGPGEPAVDVGLYVAVDLELVLTTRTCTAFGCGAGTNTVAYGAANATGGLSLESFVLDIETDISKVPGGPMTVSFGSFTSSVGLLDIDILDDIELEVGLTGIPGLSDQIVTFNLSQFVDLNAFWSQIFDPLTTLFTTGLPAILNPLIQGFAGPLLAGLFDVLELDIVLPIPNFLNPSAPDVQLGLYTDISSATFTDDGGDLGMSLGLHTEKGVERDPLGAIVRQGCLTGQSDSLTWGWDPSVGIGIKTNAINSALFAIWWSGGLNGPFDLSSLAGGSPIPIQNLNLDISWLLPPIINDCGDGEPTIEIGDLYIELAGTAFGADVTAHLYADVGLAAEFVTTPQGMSLAIGEMLFFDIEVISLDDGGLTAIDLRTLLEDGLPGILDSLLVGQEFGPFNLPPVDLSQTIPGLPAGTTLGLGNLQVVSQDGVTVIGGDLE